MDKNLALEILRKHFEKWIDDHQETLRFVVSQLYKLFDVLITISVAIVGIIIPIIISSNYPANLFLLWSAFFIFATEILIGVSWRFFQIKNAENRWPKILKQESENFHKSIKDMKSLTTDNYLEIIERNFEGQNNKVYRTTKFEALFIIVFCLGIVLFGLSLYKNSGSNIPAFKVVGAARLGMHGENIELSAVDMKGQLGKIFLFSNHDGSIATTLSIENPNIESPNFRIVKGHARDWLVVTTIENSGTGYMRHVDTWYVANSYYQGNLAVLSYPSDGYITGWVDVPNQKLTANADISADDGVVNIEFILETCDRQGKCPKTTKAAYYVWNDEKTLFILDEKKSEIDILGISGLLTRQ